MSLLDNPIWHALTTEQARFAETNGAAARFAPAVTALAGLRTADDGALTALGRLMEPGEVGGVFFDAARSMPPGLAIVDGAPLVQMLHDGPTPALPGGLVELGPDDGPAMRALVEVTRPGPFGTRTAELGRFLGIREHDALIAMAGQRMRLPGLVEVSAVCTDPAHAGRGLAARLITAQLAIIAAEGAGAFLHVRSDNTRAIALYERLGFRIRRGFDYLVLRGV